MDIEFTDYVRKPFVVQAVEITEDNIEALAKYIGELKTNKEGVTYIRVDRRLVPNVYSVYPGFFMTQMDDRIRCYTPRVFRDQFTQSSPEITTWVDFLNMRPEIDPPAGNGKTAADLAADMVE